jgi:hypothetical protein
MWRGLGVLARQGALRLEPRPMSAAAVRELSGAAGADPGAVLGATGGNPFVVTEVLSNPGVAVPPTVHDAVLARRGDPGAAALLGPAWEAATRTGSVQAIALAGTARVEAAWRAGDPEGAAALASLPLERAAARGAERYRGELLRWLARCGRPTRAFDGCPPEYALGIEGDWRGAAGAWEALGAPYEQALELADSGRPREMLAGLRTLEELGATAAADLVRGRLRRLGGDPARPPAPARDPGQPRRAHRPPARGPGPAGRGADQRRDRRPAGRLSAHRRPPRCRHPGQARVGSRREAARAFAASR